MAEFVYVIRPRRRDMLATGLTVEEQSAMGAHFRYLQEGLAAGRVLLAGRTQTTGPESFGICIFSADDEAAARSFTAADPAVAAGVMEAEVHPYKVALLAPRWPAD